MSPVPCRQGTGFPFNPPSTQCQRQARVPVTQAKSLRVGEIGKLAPRPLGGGTGPYLVFEPLTLWAPATFSCLGLGRVAETRAYKDWVPKPSLPAPCPRLGVPPNALLPPASGSPQAGAVGSPAALGASLRSPWAERWEGHGLEGTWPRPGPRRTTRLDPRPPARRRGSHESGFFLPRWVFVFLPLVNPNNPGTPGRRCRRYCDPQSACGPAAAAPSLPPALGGGGRSIAAPRCPASLRFLSGILTLRCSSRPAPRAPRPALDLDGARKGRDVARMLGGTCLGTG